MASMSLLKLGPPNIIRKKTDSVNRNIAQKVDSRIHHLSKELNIKQFSSALQKTIVKHN